MSKILVIEDEESILELIGEFLRYDNFDVVTARSGEAGLQLVDAEKPDLIMCDVSMQGMDGYAVLKALRANPVHGKVPVIFLTGQVSPDEISTGLELGANEYLAKPATRQQILAAIKRQLGTIPIKE